MPPDIILMEAIVSGRFGFNSALGHLVILGLQQLFRFQRNKTCNLVIIRMINNMFSVVSKMVFLFLFSKINLQCQGYEENVKYWKATLKLKEYVYEVTFEAEIRKSF